MVRLLLQIGEGADSSVKCCYHTSSYINWKNGTANLPKPVCSAFRSFFTVRISLPAKRRSGPYKPGFVATILLIHAQKRVRGDSLAY